MKNRLSRIVALILIPCLLADPLTAAGMCRTTTLSPYSRNPLNQSVFQKEALAAAFSLANHPLERLHGIFAERQEVDRVQKLFSLPTRPLSWRMFLRVTTSITALTLAWKGHYGMAFSLWVTPDLSGLKRLGSNSWLEENTPALQGKKILEVTAEMALSKELLDRLGNHLKTLGMTPAQIRMERRKVAMASSVGGSALYCRNVLSPKLI